MLYWLLRGVFPMTKQVSTVGFFRPRSAHGVLALVAVVAAISAARIGVAAPAASGAEPATVKMEAGGGERFLDPEADLPELQGFMQSGPNDVRDIAVVDNGFLVATGAGIIRYRYSGDVPQATFVYTSQHGLPTGNCYLLQRDANGGIWAHCQGGVGYLAPGIDRWRTFTDKNGLAPGNATNVALSPDGRRVWVSSAGGLSTALVLDQRWQAFPRKNLIDVFVHPTEDVVWCRKLIRSACMCGRHVLTTQFTLRSREWRDIPKSGNCSPAAPIPACFSDGVLWLSGGCDPPLLYDPRKNATRSWPRQPNWERITDGNVVVYSDCFGTMAPATNEHAGVWFATGAGLWQFDSKKDRWQGHLRNNKPGWGQALLAESSDGKALYWACEGTVASYDVLNEKWTDLWHVSDESYGKGRHSLALSPDGRTLWLIGLGGIMVGEIASRKAFMLSDADEPGLTAGKFVRFDPSKRLALIATPQGVVCTDYDGKPRYALTRSAAPIVHRVSRFAFAPDGSEVWCLMVDEGGFPMPPAVLLPRQNRWEVVPDPRTSGWFFCMAFSKDGKTVWLSRRQGDKEHPELVQRKPGNTRWKPFAARMPKEYSTIERLWVSPKGDELWMASGGSGLLRVKLASGEVTQYVKSDFRRHDVATHYTLAEDNVHDLVFAARGRIAVCSAGGGGNEGITRIDLETGKATNYPVPNRSIEKLVRSPDDRTVWCIFNNSLLWAFDVQTACWSHKCSIEQGMPVDYIRTLVVSPDGAFVWVRGPDGVAAYSVRDKSWKSFLGDQWGCDTLDTPLRVTSDGKHVICGHRQGIAFLKIDGSDYSVLSPGAGIKECLISHIVPIPGTADFVCSVSHPRAGGLYYVDVGHRSLRKLKDMKDSAVSAMAIGPDGFLWGAVPGRIFCVNPQTGQDRTGLIALQLGPATTTLLSRDAKADVSRVVVAPPPAVKGRVMPRPEQMPPCPSATSLHNKGMVWESTHLPCIATSKDGTTYVTWFAHPKEGDSTNASLPQIPDVLLPPGRGRGGATGICVHDGHKWLPPQLLTRGGQYCDVRFAWCQEDNLNVLVETSEANRLYHLIYRPSAQTWSKVDVLNHLDTAFSARDGMVHLAHFDYDTRRVVYRLYDGKKWSKAVWFDAKANFDGLAVAAGRDAEGHVVWKDGGGYVAHASVKDGKARYSRQDFAGRPIASRDFAIGTAPDESLIMAYRADLYEGHPDRDYAHMRTWDGRSWSEVTVIPFDTSGFHSPTFVRHRNALLLSWVSGSRVVRVFSVLASGGTWSYPLPLCSSQGDKLRCDHFVSLHFDPQGRVRAAWCVKDETYTVVVTSLEK